MKRILAAILIVGLGVASCYAGGNLLLHVGQSDSNGTAAPCVPGAATGQMDFSVCSNIAITAALW